MVRRMNLAAVAGLAMALSVAAPMTVWAGEHGGTAVAEGQEHGGAAMSQEGSHGMMEKGEAALLKEAAAALRTGKARPDLAAKLEELAKAHK